MTEVMMSLRALEEKTADLLRELIRLFAND
jgi:hypothetical protein